MSDGIDTGATRLGDGFTAVRTTGGLLPADLLSRLSSGKEVAGLTPSDYHLGAGETVREAANRAWSYLTGVWSHFRAALDNLPEEDRATSLTRERWLLVLFRELGFGRLATTGGGGIVADGKSFAISHHWEHVPVHLLGWGVELDTRSAGVAGAAGASPQALLQECLNRSDENLWAALSNGRTLRLLRDSTSLVGSAYVEFDLEAIFDGELFSDFALLFVLAHESRFEVPEDGTVADCWLERWRNDAIEQGTRALNLLRGGVKDALEHLGTGFLSDPKNAALRDMLASGELHLEDFHRALLRLVYRLLFLFVAEDRSALHEPKASTVAVERYARYFSTAHLRGIAGRRRGTRHGDLWRALRSVMHGLGRDGGLPELGLPGIGGLFEPSPLDVVI
ncbi:MAG: Eco57I restriction-modification methylase domain-containing protein, partial [Actinomycetota bacterium]